MKNFAFFDNLLSILYSKFSNNQHSPNEQIVLVNTNSGTHPTKNSNYDIANKIKIFELHAKKAK